MLRGMYVAGTGMLAQRRRMDVLTNNISNVETIGFKKDTLVTRSFEDKLLERLNDPTAFAYTQAVGPYNYGNYIDQVYTNFDQGTPEMTEREEDFALMNPGFFVVNTPEGERYTRAGNFFVTADGYLVTQEGYGVMGTNGVIQVGTNGFTADDLGNISVNGNMVNKFRIVNFTDTEALRKQGDNLFANVNNSPVTEANSIVKQGYLENSNVDVASAMVDMIEITRNYEANQRMLRIIDESLGKAVNDIARF